MNDIKKGPRKIRAHYDHEVSIKSKTNRTFETHCRNISLSGIFVESEQKLEVGEPCKVLITLKQASPPIYLKINGTVVRADDDGMGISFEKMDLDTYEHMKNLIYYNTDEVDEFVHQEHDHPGIKNLV